MVIISQQNKKDFGKAYTRLKENYQGFFDEHKGLIYLLLAAATVDCLSTIYFMHESGIHNEIHPGIKYLAYSLGPLYGPILGKYLQISLGMIAVIYFRKQAKFILVFTACMYSWAACANYLAYLIVY